MTSAVSMVALLASTLGTSVVSAASEFLPYASVLADNAVIGTQSSEAAYRLGDTITRAELAKVTANLGGYTATECSGTVYGDVSSKLGDLCGYIEALAQAGVVSTKNANFRPTASVTRAEMTKMLLGAVGETASTTDAGYTDLNGLGDLAGYVNRANELGCASSATYFRPNATSSRGEAFKMAACAAQLDTTTTEPTVPPSNGSGTTTTTGSTTTGSTVAGALSVALDGTAVAQYVPKNASSVKVGTVKLSANGGDVTINSLVVSRSGLGAAADILSSNGVRASQSGVIISSSSDYYNATSQKANVYFSPALVVKAGTSTSVDILVNLSAQQNSQHQFTLDSVNTTAGVVATTTTLGLINTTSYETATTAVNLSNASSSLTPGKTNQSVVKVEITSGGRETKVNGFTLTRAGVDFTKRLANVQVYRGGVAVGKVTLTAEKLSVTGLSDVLASGNTQTYEVKADILVDGSTSSKLAFKFDATSDVSASEVATGYATTVTTSPAAGTAQSDITFDNVEVTFSKLSTANVTLAPGTNNVKFFNGKLTSSTPLTIRGLRITPTLNTLTGADSSGTATGTKIMAFVNDQLSVKVNGSEVGTITSLSASYVDLAPSFVVDSTNPATVTIEGSIKSNQNVKGAITFSVEITSARDSSNNTATVGAGKSLTGDKTTINTAEVKVQTATVAAPSTSRIYASADQEIGRFAVYAQNEAVRLQKFVVTNGGNASLSGIVSSASSVKLRDVATNAEISATATVSGNTLTLESMNDKIAMDTTKNYAVIATISSIDNDMSKTIQLAYSSSTIVRDTNSNALTPTSTSVSFKQYTLGTVPPTVKVTKTSDLNKYLVTVTNVDTNTGITLTGVTVKFQSRFAGSTSVTYTGKLCLRDQGSSTDCTGTGGLGTSSGYTIDQAGLTQIFSLNGLTSAGNELSKNGGNTTFEVYLQGAPIFAAGDLTQVSVDKVFYAGTSENYVGVAGASEISTK
jgi:S-layer homology domain